MNKELEQIAKELSKEIIKEIMPALKKELKRDIKKEIIKDMKEEKQKKIYHNTYVLMINYNRFKQHVKKVKITNEIEELDKYIDDNLNEINKINRDDSVEKYIIEIDAADEKFIRSILKSKIRTATMLAFIDEALKIIRNEYKAQGKYERYRAFEMFFIERKTNKEIMEALFCGKNRPKAWSDEVLKELSLLLWGIDAFNDLIA